MSLADDEVVALFQKESGRMRGYLIKIGAPPDLADDFVNDAFLAVRRRWPQLRDTNPLAYAYTVARNQFRQELRRQRREFLTSDPMDSLPDVTSDPTAGLDQAADAAAVRRALDRMPAKREKEAVLLRHVQGFGVAETARIMGISTGAVQRYTYDGLRRLRALIEDDGTREGESR